MNKRLRHYFQFVLIILLTALLAFYVLSLFTSYLEINKHSSYEAYSIEESKKNKVFICEYQPDIAMRDSAFGITSAWLDVTFKYEMDLFFNRSIVPLKDTVLKILATPDAHNTFTDLKTGKRSYGTSISPYSGFDISLGYDPDSLFLQITNCERNNWADTILFTKKSSP